MAMQTSGNWYFWVYSCDAAVELKVEDGNPETAMATIPKGGSYLYKEITQNGTKQFVVRPSRDSLEKKGNFIMYSSMVDEENFKSFDVKNDSLEIQVSIQSQENSLPNNVTVQFEPVEFIEDSDPSDEVIYQVKLCPERAQHYAEAKFCSRDETCLDSEVRLSAKQKEIITIDFQRLREGKYSVRIKATIIHKNQPIKFIQPYTESFIEIKTKKTVKPIEPVKEKLVEEGNRPEIWKFVVGIVALGLVMAAGVIGLKKVKSGQENKGGHLQSPPDSSTNGFKPLEDEEAENDDSQIERNGI